jgi:uncharacterized protein
MKVGLLHVTIHIPQAQSLKDRRRELRSVKDLLHNRLNVAVAEVSEREAWQSAELAVTTVAKDGARVREILEKSQKLMERNLNIEVIDPSYEVW